MATARGKNRDWRDWRFKRTTVCGLNRSSYPGCEKIHCGNCLYIPQQASRMGVSWSCSALEARPSCTPIHNLWPQPISVLCKSSGTTTSRLNYVPTMKNLRLEICMPPLPLIHIASGAGRYTDLVVNLIHESLSAVRLALRLTRAWPVSQPSRILPSTSAPRTRRSTRRCRTFAAGLVSLKQ